MVEDEFEKKTETGDPDPSPEKAAPLFMPIYDVLKEKNQISISGMARALKECGADEHRLVVTGYLRALRDLGCLTEINIQPSKIYMANKRSDELFSLIKADSLKAASSDGPFSVKDRAAPVKESLDDTLLPEGGSSENPSLFSAGPPIYARLRSRIAGITDRKRRFEVAVYVLCHLFDRPCFESEILLTGCDADTAARYFSQPAADQFVRKVNRPDIRKLLLELKIGQKGNAAYEAVSDASPDTLFLSNQILFSLLKEELDLAGLVSKQTIKNLFDF